jgi:hypothetical protein
MWGGGGVDYMRDIYFEWNVAQIFWYALFLVEVFYLSLSTGTSSEL